MGWSPWRSRAREGAPEAKESRAGVLAALATTGRPRWTPRDYARLAQEGFGRNPVAYRCIRMVAEAAAATPLKVLGEGAGADTLGRLLTRPNPEQSGPEFLEQLYGFLQTAGNAYVEAAGDETPEELWALRPDRVKVVPGRSGWAEAYEYGVDGRSVRIGRGADGWLPVLQLKLFHPDG
jgi:phage portal protein BeeE